MADPAPTRMTARLASVHQSTTARACCDEVDDDVLRVRDAAAAALGYTAVHAPEDNEDSETGNERPVGLSSMYAHMPACCNSAIPAPPMMTGMPNMLFSGLLSAPPSLALASTSNVSPRRAGLGRGCAPEGEFDTGSGRTRDALNETVSTRAVSA